MEGQHQAAAKENSQHGQDLGTDIMINRSPIDCSIPDALHASSGQAATTTFSISTTRPAAVQGQL